MTPLNGHLIRRLRALLAGSSVLAFAAAMIAIGPAAPAQASPCSPWPQCFGTAYQVSGTTDNSLAEWTNSPSLGGSVVGHLPNGATLWVACQANDGPQEDGKFNAPGVPSRTWDFAWDPGISRYVWVYDWWMNTPAQQKAYGWYSWGDSAHHCNFGGPPPGPPPAVTTITVVPTSSNNFHVQWQDNSRGGAAYVISNGNYSQPDLAYGATSYDWSTVPGNYECFTVAAKANGLQSAWSPYACATTPSDAWCPNDTSKPACDGTGAFQANWANPPDYGTIAFNPSDPAQSAAFAEAAAGVIYFQQANQLVAGSFFSYYLAGSGQPLAFNSTAAYHAGSGFAAAVDLTVKTWIRMVSGGATAFDSGWTSFPAPDAKGNPGNTSLWNNIDWQHAVGHGFYRVVGTRQPNGSWSVNLQLTSYYQFRPDGPNFGPLSQLELRLLEIIGSAQNFREVGTGTLSYTSAGNPG